MSLLKLIQYKNIFFFNISTILFMLLIAPINKAQDLPDEFLDTLPADVQEQFNEAAKQNENEEKLEGLFRLDTSQKKNQLILKILKNQLKELELRVNGSSNQDLNYKGLDITFLTQHSRHLCPLTLLILVMIMLLM